MPFLRMNCIGESWFNSHFSKRVIVRPVIMMSPPIWIPIKQTMIVTRSTSLLTSQHSKVFMWQKKRHTCGREQKPTWSKSSISFFILDNPISTAEVAQSSRSYGTIFLLPRRRHAIVPKAVPPRMNIGCWSWESCVWLQIVTFGKCWHYCKLSPKQLRT